RPGPEGVLVSSRSLLPNEVAGAPRKAGDRFIGEISCECQFTLAVQLPAHHNSACAQDMVTAGMRRNVRKQCNNSLSPDRKHAAIPVPPSNPLWLVELAPTELC